MPVGIDLLFPLLMPSAFVSSRSHTTQFRLLAGERDPQDSIPGPPAWHQIISYISIGKDRLATGCCQRNEEYHKILEKLGLVGV